MLQAISFNSLTLFFVPFALLRVEKAMVIIYNINKFVTSRGERGTGSWSKQRRRVIVWSAPHQRCFCFSPSSGCGGRQSGDFFFLSFWSDVFSPTLYARPPTFAPVSVCQCVTVHEVLDVQEDKGWVGWRESVVGHVGGGRGHSWRWSSVSAAVLGAALVLKVVVTVLTNPHRRRDLQPLDLRLEATAPAERGGGGHRAHVGRRDTAGPHSRKRSWSKILLFVRH